MHKALAPTLQTPICTTDHVRCSSCPVRGGSKAADHMPLNDRSHSSWRLASPCARTALGLDLLLGEWSDCAHSADGAQCMAHEAQTAFIGSLLALQACMLLQGLPAPVKLLRCPLTYTCRALWRLGLRYGLESLRHASPLPSAPGSLPSALWA